MWRSRHICKRCALLHICTVTPVRIIWYAFDVSFALQDGTERPCDEPFHLLSPHICRLKSVGTPRRPGDDAGGGLQTTQATEIPPTAVSILQGHTSEVFTCSFNPRNDFLATGWVVLSLVAPVVLLPKTQLLIYDAVVEYPVLQVW
jgi:hypothetical protein